jgi:DNA-directed RNA polymerase subunit M/transcription elongation factor TFIIS
LKREKIIKIFEKYIHTKSLKSENYDTTYRKILYQSVGDILNGKNLAEMIDNIKKDMIGWNHPTFIDIKNRIGEHDEFIINPFEVEEGETTCHCGAGRVFTYQKQTRGADEPMTTFAKCVKCKAQWTYSG